METARPSPPCRWAAHWWCAPLSENFMHFVSSSNRKHGCTGKTRPRKHWLYQKSYQNLLPRSEGDPPKFQMFTSYGHQHLSECRFVTASWRSAKCRASLTRRRRRPAAGVFRTATKAAAPGWDWSGAVDFALAGRTRRTFAAAWVRVCPLR